MCDNNDTELLKSKDLDTMRAHIWCVWYWCSDNVS